MTDECVTVFFDWQNVYREARRAFHSPADPNQRGQVNPTDLAEVLTARVPGRTLTGIRIYRGMPVQEHDQEAYNAARRQQTGWCKDPRVVVTHRKLRYPEGWTKGDTTADIREKGIDVALAIDLVTMATDGQYDTAILMSCDHDLLPALERVHQKRLTRGDGPQVEVAAWKSPFKLSSPRLRLANGGPFCHWIDQQDYWGVEDSRNYNSPSPADMPGRRR